LSANEDIRIGDDTATNPVPKGRELETIIRRLVAAMRAGYTGPGEALSIPSSGSAVQLLQIENDLPDLLSEQVKIKK
jgi:hypothetical protein